MEIHCSSQYFWCILENDRKPIHFILKTDIPFPIAFLFHLILKGYVCEKRNERNKQHDLGHQEKINIYFQ